LALTFGTLLSSQGAGAHRYWASRPVSGQLAKRYSAGFAVSNPEVWPHHPHITLGRGIRGVGGMGARPVRRSTGVRGVEHGRRTVAVESNPLSPLSRTAVRCPRRLSSTVAVAPAGRPAVEHGPGRNRPRWPHFARPERPGRPAPTLRPSRPSTRTGRVAGDTCSRRLSGGLMLVTTAVDPPRRPTSDPRSQLTIGTGCSLRRAPDDGTSDGTLSWYELTCAGGRSLGRSRRRAPMRSASRVVRPATTLPGVYSGPAPGSLTARTGEPSAVGP